MRKGEPMQSTELDPESEIEQIEGEIRQRPQLTDKQLEDIRELCERIRSACDAGHYGEARRIKGLCMSVIAQGSPVPE